MDEFNPDYNNILLAAKNIEPKRLPLYEHLISPRIMEKIRMQILVKSVKVL